MKQHLIKVFIGQNSNSKIDLSERCHEAQNQPCVSLYCGHDLPCSILLLDPYRSLSVRELKVLSQVSGFTRSRSLNVYDPITSTANPDNKCVSGDVIILAWIFIFYRSLHICGISHMMQLNHRNTVKEEMYSSCSVGAWSPNRKQHVGLRASPGCQRRELCNKPLCTEVSRNRRLTCVINDVDYISTCCVLGRLL